MNGMGGVVRPSIGLQDCTCEIWLLVWKKATPIAWLCYVLDGYCQVVSIDHLVWMYPRVADANSCCLWNKQQIVIIVVGL